MSLRKARVALALEILANKNAQHSLRAEIVDALHDIVKDEKGRNALLEAFRMDLSANLRNRLGLPD